MKLQLVGVLPTGIALLLTTGAAVPAAAQETRERARTTAQEARQDTGAAARKTGNAVTDSWITMKVHSQFVPEDALEESDIDVETNAGVVTLTGTVATAAGKSRAVAIAKATEGVRSVSDRLRVAPEDADDAAAAARRGTAATGAAAGATAREGARETREAGRTAGMAVSDGWLTSKIYAQFITENALDDSDIDVEVDKGVVTLTGMVMSKAGSTRAAQLAQQTDGVTSVKNNLKVKASK